MKVDEGGEKRRDRQILRKRFCEDGIIYIFIIISLHIMRIFKA